MTKGLKNNLLLILTALIWGCAFVAQSVGVEYVGPFTFNSVRNILGGLALLPVILLRDKLAKKEAASAMVKTSAGMNGAVKEAVMSENMAAKSEAEKKAAMSETVAAKSEAEKKQERRTLIIGGICCGFFLAVASSLQQIGLVYTTAGKAGFITALYILIVPLLGLIIGKRVGIKVWIGVALAVMGMYCLCITEGFTIAKGDILVMLCAVVFSFHILVIDYFSPKVDGVKMSCIQFWVCGILCAIPMFLTETPQIDQILAAWLPIAYAGILSCGVAYTLQIIAQKNVDPTVASLLLSLESVFAVLAGGIILHESLSAKEMIGCALVFAAIILAQLPQKGKKKK
ncbi:MAG: DMT family transporter [Ruminococcus sp.]|nr:DMT family transporter [Ruminococcus sp.]